MVTATVNGRELEFPDDDDLMLADVLRDPLGLTGTKLVCGAGVCGACTVLVDGEAVASCLTPAKVDGRASHHHRRGHRRRRPASRAARLHGAGRAAMRLLHARLHRRGARRSMTNGAPRMARRRPRARRSAPPSPAISAAAAPMRTSIARSPTPAPASTTSRARDAPRLEARDKVTGAAVYTLDIRHDGQLEGAILRSPHARARIAALDLCARAGAAGRQGRGVAARRQPDRDVRRRRRRGGGGRRPRNGRARAGGDPRASTSRCRPPSAPRRR